MSRVTNGSRPCHIRRGGGFAADQTGSSRQALVRQSSGKQLPSCLVAQLAVAAWQLTAWQLGNSVVRQSSGTRQAFVTGLRPYRAWLLTGRGHCQAMTRSRFDPPLRPVQRVIVVVADGVRPDVIPLLDLPNFTRLARHGRSTMHGRTVSPSVTAAAMSSLLTGVRPTTHGMTTDQFKLPRPRHRLDPLPGVLRQHGIPSSAWMARVPWTYRRLATTLVRRLGFDRASFEGDGAEGVLEAATTTLQARTPGLCLMHWPDADRAGHDHGWPSPAYLRAVRWLDRCLGELEEITSASSDPDTLLIVLADHGGGGRRRRFHDSDHPLDFTIPIILAGGRVPRGTLRHDASLLDVPATVLHALGAPIPETYCGRTLHEFVARRRARSVKRDLELAIPLAAAG